MAKKRTDTAKPRTQSGDRHKNRVVSLRPTPGLREVIQAIADAERRSLAQVALILLEEALAARGLWPPPSA